MENNSTIESDEEDDDYLSSEEVSESLKDYINEDTITYFSNKKKYFCLIKSSGLQHIEKWELNRKLNNNRVEKLYTVINSNLETDNDINMHEPLHIAFNSDEDTYKLVDGQHRYAAVSKLYDENKYAIFDVPCVVHVVTCEKEMMDLLQEINNRLPLSKEEFIKYKIPLIIDFISKKWSKDSWTPFGKNRPSINKDKFEKKLKEYETELEKISLEKISLRLEKINMNIRKLPRSKRVIGKNIRKNVNDKADTYDFFLGLDKEMNWFKYIISATISLKIV